MKVFFSIFLTIGLTTALHAQSGRQKPSPTPSPKPITGPSGIYVPMFPSPKLSPSPTPKTINDDLIKVEAALVPIPVSVLDANGRPITNLKVDDFELRVDSQIAKIDDLARSETPIRLAMLFDNSSSVMIARDFEKEAA